MSISVVLILSACTGETDRSINPISDEAAAEENLREQRECWQKEVLSLIYIALGKTVMGMYSKLTNGAMSVMMVSFAIWFAMRLMKFLSSVAEENSAEVWNEVIRKAFICLFCGILASSTTGLLYALNIFIFPVYNAFLEFGSAMMSLATSDSTAATNINVLGESIDISKYSLSCAYQGNPEATLDAFPTTAQSMMECMICALSSRLQLGLQIAYTVMSGSGLTAVIIGIVLYACFGIVWLGFVFYLVDTIFKFAMMVLLLPIFIMAYAFGPTKKWMTTALVNILTSAAFMMAISIMITMTLIALVELINSKPDIFNPANPELVMRDFSVAMICLMLIAFLVVGTLGVAQQVTSAIIGGKPSAEFQKKLKAVGEMVVGWLTGGASKAIKAAGFYENSKLGRGLKRLENTGNKIKELAGRRDQ